MFTLEVVSRELGGLAGWGSGILSTHTGPLTAWYITSVSRAKAETENKKSLRAAALFLFWLKSQIQKTLIPAAASTCNLLDFMAPFGASSGNNIKFEERHGKQNKIYRKFANEFVLFLFIDNFYWKTVIFQSVFHVWKTHRTYGLWQKLFLSH